MGLFVATRREKGIYRLVATLHGERMKYIPRDDVYQEIRIARLVAPNNELRESARRINILLNQYGYSRRKGKDAFDPERLYMDIDPEETEQYRQGVEEKIAIIKYLADQGLDGRRVCEVLGARFNPQISRLLLRVIYKKPPTPRAALNYDETLAKDIIASHNLKPSIILSWRFNKRIPKKYITDRRSGAK